MEQTKDAGSTVPWAIKVFQLNWVINDLKNQLKEYRSRNKKLKKKVRKAIKRYRRLRRINA